MAEVIKAWQCIGCGRIEGPQTCIGICQDKPQKFVYADDYERLEAFVRQVALAQPHRNAWEASYRALQARAKELMRAGI